MSQSMVEIRSVTSKVRRRKKTKTTAVKCTPLGIAMPSGLINTHTHIQLDSLQYQAKKLAEKTVSKMTCSVSSVT